MKNFTYWNRIKKICDEWKGADVTVPTYNMQYALEEAQRLLLEGHAPELFKADIELLKKQLQQVKLDVHAANKLSFWRTYNPFQSDVYVKSKEAYARLADLEKNGKSHASFVHANTKRAAANFREMNKSYEKVMGSYIEACLIVESMQMTNPDFDPNRSSRIHRILADPAALRAAGSGRSSLKEPL